MMKYLFLDDLRIPEEAYIYTKQEMFLNRKWDIVRNYKEFVEYISINGFPDFVYFDHDLADSHYTPEEYWYDYEVSKAWQEAQVHTEKTGLDCAKWLIEYCINNNLKLPSYYCHSMNPVGKDNILSLLNNFNSFPSN